MINGLRIEIIVIQSRTNSTRAPSTPISIQKNTCDDILVYLYEFRVETKMYTIRYLFPGQCRDKQCFTLQKSCRIQSLTIAQTHVEEEGELGIYLGQMILRPIADFTSAFVTLHWDPPLQVTHEDLFQLDYCHDRQNELTVTFMFAITVGGAQD